MEYALVNDRKQSQTSLRQKIYELIKRDIITCKLPPGEQLVEGDLAEKFQTSKTPVREALTSLVHENLVEYRPNKGFMVSMITLKDIQEIFEARIFFETTLMRLAVRNITDSEVLKLESYQDFTYDVNDPDSLDGYIQANIDFHMDIALASRNNRLCWHYKLLLNDASRLIYMDAVNHNVMPTWHQSHDRFIDALRKRDAEAGARAIEETMENAKKRILGG